MPGRRPAPLPRRDAGEGRQPVRPRAAGARRRIRTAGFPWSRGSPAGQDGPRWWAREGEARSLTRCGRGGRVALAQGAHASATPRTCRAARGPRCGGIALGSRVTRQGSERCRCPGSQVAALRKSSPQLVAPEPREGRFPPGREEHATQRVTKVTESKGKITKNFSVRENDAEGGSQNTTSTCTRRAALLRPGLRARARARSERPRAPPRRTPGDSHCGCRGVAAEKNERIK